MEFKKTYFHCGKNLLKSLQENINQIENIIHKLVWSPSFEFVAKEKIYKHQTGYNKYFSHQFTKFGWENQPKLRSSPRLIGDFQKGLVFVEIQFGNSSTLYRDFYKFQYGHFNGLLSLAVHIVPANPKDFFPTRSRSIANMASFELAKSCFTIVPINVPVLLIGLLPKN
jgi:hypothetical protein